MLGDSANAMTTTTRPCPLEQRTVQPFPFPFSLPPGTLGTAMAKRKLSLSAIRRVAAALPGVEEGTSYGTLARRHRGKFLTRLHQDGDSIVLKIGNETRDHLLQADPQTFFITDHYISYPMMLAHLDRLSAADFKKLLVRAMEMKGR